MSLGAVPGPEEVPCLISEFGKLADDIASLPTLLAEAEGTDAAVLIQQIVRHLKLAMEQLMDRPGMLAAPAPWWTEWQSNRAAR